MPARGMSHAPRSSGRSSGWPLLVLALLLASFHPRPVSALPAAGLPTTVRGFSIVATDSDGLVVECVHQPTQIDDRDGDLAPEVGADEPEAVTWIAVPRGATATATMTVLEEVPASWVNALTPEMHEQLNRFLSEPLELLGAPTRLRNQRVVPLRHRWLRRDGAGGLREITRARFRIAFHENPSSQDGSGASDGAPRGSETRISPTGADLFEHLYKGTVLNYAQGRAWRTAMRPPLPRGGDYFSSTNAPWVKVWCDHEDLYVIEGTALEALGIDLDTIDPETLRMFTPLQVPLDEETPVDEAPDWMSPLAIRLSGMEDGRFDPTDRIQFIGYGPDSWYSTKGIAPTVEDYARDPYNNENPYWLTWGGGFSEPPARILEQPTEPPSPPYETTVRDRVHVEEDHFYDARMQKSPLAWERFWWAKVTAVGTRDEARSLSFTIPDPVESENVRIFARFWGANNPRWSRPDHDLEVRLNDRPVGRYSWENVAAQDVREAGVWLVPGATQELQITARGREERPDFVVDQIAFAFLDLEYTRRLHAHDDAIAFFADDRDEERSFAIDGFQAEDLLVFDVTRANVPEILPAQFVAEGGGRTLQFRADGGHVDALPARIVVRSLNRAASPRLERVRTSPEGYLRERTDPAQMVIITHDDFREAAEELAAYRRRHFPDRAQAGVSVVDVEEIFDEFSFGRRDPVAIRNFLQWSRTHWTGGDPEDGPAYVVLVGDAHFDPRGKVTTTFSDFVPTYLDYFDRTLLSSNEDPRFSSDDFFGLLDGADDQALDLFIGRLSVETPGEAATVVRKVISYEEESDLGDWRNRMTLVADDICQGTTYDILGWSHLGATERLDQDVLPRSLEREKLYLIEYGAECIYPTKPQATADLIQAINRGTLVVNFVGHGGEGQIADERLFDLASVGSLTNARRPCLFLTASCSVGKYDVSTPSLAEAMIRHPNGGAVAVFSATSVARAYGNRYVNEGFFAHMFPDRNVAGVRPVGESVAAAKLQDPELNSRRYVLHGDPAVRLLVPREPVQISISGAATGANGDTLRRGDVVEISGQVTTAEGAPAEFEGEAIVTVFDSAVLRQPEPGFPPYDYELPGAVIFRGTTAVRNGVLGTTF
ncbi:MAG: hypothetical protein KC729_11155, partial [Candidatus Eisenbacteria bacterium]|nr:hypothetical protein [Candidatus Eisenbacteria bacterium]